MHSNNSLYTVWIHIIRIKFLPAQNLMAESGRAIILSLFLTFLYQLFIVSCRPASANVETAAAGYHVENLYEQLIDGDMYFGEIDVQEKGSSRKRRAALSYEPFKWPTPTIPYQFDTVHPVSKYNLTKYFHLFNLIHISSK